MLAHTRALGLLVAIVLVSAGCGPREEIVYVDPREHAADGTGAYTPFARSTDPLVHADGAHEPAAAVQIGPASDGGDPTPYTPFAGSGEPLVHADADAHVPAAKVAIATERERSSESRSEPATASASSSKPSAESGHSSAETGHGSAPTPGTSAAAGARAPGSEAAPGARAPGATAALKPAPSPTPPTRLALGNGLGATPGTPTPDKQLLAGDDDDHRGQATVSGKIESITGQTLKVQTLAGPQDMRLAANVRVERDSPATPADLKPGQFVGVAHLPLGPAESIRLYATGPNMPQPGIAPVVGSRSGQVTTFGSVVALQFGGLLLNTGSQTTTVTLPNGVPILRAAQGATDLAVGSQVMATGPVGEDGVLVATAVRVTAAAPPGR